MDRPTALQYLSQVRNLLKSDVSVNYHTASHVIFVPCPRVVRALSAVFSYPDPQTSSHVGLGMRLRMSADDTCSVHRMSEYYLQPTHKAICVSCEMYTLVQVGRRPMIHKSLSVVAEWNTPSNSQLTNCSHREGRVQVTMIPKTP